MIIQIDNGRRMLFFAIRQFGSDSVQAYDSRPKAYDSRPKAWP
jgi:hypothetical protein